MYSFSQYQQLNEKLILYNNGARYGQVVFLAGGPGSGKTFAASKFMELDKFKVISVDDIKDTLLKLLQKEHPGDPELTYKNPKLAAGLHDYVARRRFKGKTVRGILKGSSPDRLPNLMFDTTLRDLGDLHEYLPLLAKAGYKSKDIHITWVLTDYRIALDRNAKRDRQVPTDALISMHGGSAFTLAKLIEKGKPPLGIDGEVRVVFNNPGDSDIDSKGRVNNFSYLTLKKRGKPMTTERELINQVRAWQRANTPKTFQTKGIIHPVK